MVNGLRSIESRLSVLELLGPLEERLPPEYVPVPLPGYCASIPVVETSNNRNAIINWAYFINSHKVNFSKKAKIKKGPNLYWALDYSII